MEALPRPMDFVCRFMRLALMLRLGALEAVSRDYFPPSVSPIHSKSVELEVYKTVNTLPTRSSSPLFKIPQDYIPLSEGRFGY
jgi:hypothetical protein